MVELKLKAVNGECASPRLSVIFVHGLGGDPVETWCCEGGEDGGYFWPLWLAEDMKGLAVYSLGYPADKASWNTGWPIAEAAIAALDRLMSNRALRASGDTPIVFVCHSLGGLIVKKLVLTADRDRGQDAQKGKFLDRIRGVVFLATPHGGSIMATIPGQLQWFVSDSMHDLKANDAALLDLSNSYRNCVADNHARIRHRVFYEKRPMFGLAKAVAPMSADPGIAGVRPVAVDRDHASICKPLDRDDQVYESVLAFLESEALAPREPTQVEKIDQVGAKLAELVELARQGGAFRRAEQEGISEFAVRKIVVRLGGEGIGQADLLPWLDNWIEAAQRELGRRTNEDEAFELARQEAERRFKTGQGNPSSALMEEFAREERIEIERQGERKRRRLGLLEAAIRFDELVLDADAATQKMRRMAEIEGRSGWQEIGAYLFAQADEYYERGDQKGQNSALLISIAAYRAALEERTRDRVPLDWATTQNNLGIALRKLGERESGTARLEEAVAAYRAALKERTRDRVPLQWAATQNALGNALMRLGSRESGTARLEEAVSAYRAALEERTRDRVPLDWASTQNNLGIALSALGERERGTARLEEAVSAYRAALEEGTRDRVPLDWAMTQNNLGAALRKLGERESGTARLEEAVSAYRAALEERTRERVPLDWAMTQNNLGNALSALGSRESGTARLEEAVSAYRAALEEGTRDRVPLQWATTQNALGAALRKLGSRESGTARLEEAVSAYRAALKERTRDRVPLQWATTQNALGKALLTLGWRESGTARLEEAVAACRAALEEGTRDRVPLQWATTQNDLGAALWALGSRESGTGRLEEAVAAYRAVLEEWTKEAAPYWHDETQRYLDGAITLLAQRLKK
jgi:tetratricopeptide (TPR) repeat protein